MAIVPLSPADKAGLRANDQLMSVNARVLSRIKVDFDLPPTRAFIERSQKIILEEMNTGAVTLRVSRAGEIRSIRFAPELGCFSNVELVPGRDVNAWADGERVVVSAGIVAECTTDDELALVVAHELAHNLLDHGPKLASGKRSGGRDMKFVGTGSAAMRKSEEEADRLAIGMLTAAGYDVTHAEALMGRLLDERTAVPVAGTHPAAERRLALLRAEVARARAAAPVRQPR